jgi:hypothetical protein
MTPIVYAWPVTPGNTMVTIEYNQNKKGVNMTPNRNPKVNEFDDSPNSC